MVRRNIFIFISLLLNIIFILILAFKFESPFIDKTSDNYTPSEEVEKEIITISQVIGKEEETESVSSKVAKVIDGDTIVLDNGETVRYIGIDAPEVSRGQECFAEESTNKNKELVLDKSVRLEKDVSETDKYQRLLRYVWVKVGPAQEMFVNELLVREGYATVVTYPPDTKFAELFRQAEKEAKENNRGLWGRCIVEPPQESARQNDIQQGKWDCSKNIYNCADFSSHAEAQSAFESCGGASNDIHRLDSDKDGFACEGLP